MSKKEKAIKKFLAEPAKEGDIVFVRGLGTQDKTKFANSTKVLEVNDDGSIMIKEYGYSSLIRVEKEDYYKNTRYIGADPFPYRISRSSVAYGDRQQGRPPIRELIGAVFAYGLNVGAQRQKINEEDMWAVRSARDVLSYVVEGRLTVVVEGRLTVEELKARAERAIKNIDFKYQALREK